jgi:hypothetical protein
MFLPGAIAGRNCAAMPGQRGRRKAQFAQTIAPNGAEPRKSQFLEPHAVVVQGSKLDVFLFTGTRLGTT